MISVRVFWLLSRPTAQGTAALALPFVAFASVTTLLTLVVGGAGAFWAFTGDTAPIYQALAIIALALLVVPLASLGGAAARLAVRRRDDRLAVLRLLGATGRQVSAVTVLEAASVAFAGALVGVVFASGLSPLVGLISFRGEALGLGVLLSPVSAAAIVLGVGALATVSAVIGLRRVVISPLGVALRQSPPRLSWVRVLVGVLAVAAVYLLTQNLNAVATSAVTMVLVLALGYALVLAVLGVVGPWFIGVLARRKAMRAHSPADLLAARMILDAPKTVWRQVSGVAMASFMAVFAGSGMAIVQMAEGSATGQAGEGADPAAQFLVGDIRTGILITVIGSFLMVASAVGVSQAAALLDRRDIIRSLHMLGTPMEVQDRSRTSAVMLPLLLASLGSAIVAAVLVFPLLGIAVVLAPLSVGIVFASIAAGIALVAVSIRATAPLLRGLAASPSVV